MYAEQFDYIIINDCSNDNTLKVLKQNRYSYIDLPINLGIGAGVQTGYKYAMQNNYDIAIQMDGDGQHSGEYLQALIDPIINEKAEFVIGSRYIQHEGFQSSFLRRIGINFLSSDKGKSVCKKLCFIDMNGNMFVRIWRHIC